MLEYVTTPRNLVPVNIMKTKVYTSESMKKQFINYVYTSRKLSPVADSIKKLVLDGKILIAYASKNTTELIIRKMLNRALIVKGDMFASSYGFYEMYDNKLVILMESNTKFFIFTNNRMLDLVIIHELMHMCTANINKVMWSKFKSLVLDFYVGFFCNYYMINSEKIVPYIEKTYKYLFERESISSNYSAKSTKRKIISLLEKLEEYSTYDADTTRKLTIQLMHLITKVAAGYNPSAGVIFSNIIKLLGYQYRRIFGHVSKGVLFGQEILNPSEIICIASEVDIDRSKYFNAIKLLANKVG